MSPEVPVETLTIKHFIEDVDHIVTFLKEKFHKEKVFLLGYSFGGCLGFMYLLEHQDKIEKFVSAGGALSTAAIEINGYQTVLELSKKADNQEAVEKLSNLGPPPYETFQEGMVWRTLGMLLLAGMGEGISKNLDMSKVMSITGIESIDPDWMKKSMMIANTMWSELITIDIEDKVQNINIPMLSITGAKDIMVPFRILEKGFENYGGPKEYFILENSNHMMFVDEPELFISKVIDFFQK
jgi:pimeloyl-ACP methyl ester carboxylesterase